VTYRVQRYIEPSPTESRRKRNNRIRKTTRTRISFKNDNNRLSPFVNVVRFRFHLNCKNRARARAMLRYDNNTLPYCLCFILVSRRRRRRRRSSRVADETHCRQPSQTVSLLLSDTNITRTEFTGATYIIVVGVVVIMIITNERVYMAASDYAVFGVGPAWPFICQKSRRRATHGGHRIMLLYRNDKTRRIALKTERNKIKTTIAPKHAPPHVRTNPFPARSTPL